MAAALATMSGVAAVVVALVGVGVAAYTNSPRNRQGNELASIGVAEGVAQAVVAGLVASFFFLFAWWLARPRPSGR